MNSSHPLRVGLFGIGLEAYWPQFEGLKPRLEGYLSQVADKITRPGVDICNLGLIDSPEKAMEADPGAVEGVGDLRNRAGSAVGEPFAGHLGSVTHFIESLVVHGSHGLEIEDDDRNFSPLNHGKYGGAQRIGGDVEEDDGGGKTRTFMGGRL